MSTSYILHFLSIISLVNFRVQNTFFVFLMQIIVMQLVKGKMFFVSYINAIIYLFYKLCNNMSICLSRVDKIILDAVSTLKETNGSSKSVIATLIEVIMFKPYLGMFLHQEYNSMGRYHCCAYVRYIVQLEGDGIRRYFLHLCFNSIFSLQLSLLEINCQ